MNTCHAANLPLSEAVCSTPRDLLSLREVVTLADVSEKRVRKDIETGILSKPLVVRLSDARLCFEWRHVLVVAAVYGNSLLTGSLRKVAVARMDAAIRENIDIVFSTTPGHLHFMECKNYRNWKEDIPKYDLHLDKYISLDLDKVWHNVFPRLSVYASGLSRIEEKKDVLGGEAVFKDTRLSVAHIGKMVVDGETVKNIIDDFPSLNESDVRFAELYYMSHPSIGRPKTRGGWDDATCCP